MFLSRADASATSKDSACALAPVCAAVGRSFVAQRPGWVGSVARTGLRDWALKEPGVSLMWKKHESGNRGGRELER